MGLTRKQKFDQMMNTVVHGDCLEIMRKFPSNCIDTIITDIPYGLTACFWDKVPDLERMWTEWKRIIKLNSAVVMTASQPFTSILVISNIKMFKYEWIWEKHQGTNPMSAKISPLKSHENILVFGKGRIKYNPQMEKGKPYSNFISNNKQSDVYGGGISIHRDNKEGTRYPKTILRFTKDKGKRFHPTQKPVALFEYLIKTYTNEGDLVLDPFIGGGTTAIACINTNRNFIGIEIEKEYCEIARKRIGTIH